MDPPTSTDNNNLLETLSTNSMEPIFTIPYEIFHLIVDDVLQSPAASNYAPGYKIYHLLLIFNKQWVDRLRGHRAFAYPILPPRLVFNPLCRNQDILHRYQRHFILRWLDMRGEQANLTIDPLRLTETDASVVPGDFIRYCNASNPGNQEWQRSGVNAAGADAVRSDIMKMLLEHPRMPECAWNLTLGEEDLSKVSPDVVLANWPNLVELVLRDFSPEELEKLMGARDEEELQLLRFPKLELFIWHNRGFPSPRLILPVNLPCRPLLRQLSQISLSLVDLTVIPEILDNCPNLAYLCFTATNAFKWNTVDDEEEEPPGLLADPIIVPFENATDKPAITISHPTLLILVAYVHFSNTIRLDCPALQELWTDTCNIVPSDPTTTRGAWPYLDTLALQLQSQPSLRSFELLMENTPCLRTLHLPFDRSDALEDLMYSKLFDHLNNDYDNPDNAVWSPYLQTVVWPDEDAYDTWRVGDHYSELWCEEELAERLERYDEAEAMRNSLGK